MADDVVLNKAATIERCLARVGEEQDDHGHELAVDQRRQDALVLNLLRASETAIIRHRLGDLEAFATAMVRDLR